MQQMPEPQWVDQQAAKKDPYGASLNNLWLASQAATQKATARSPDDEATVKQIFGEDTSKAADNLAPHLYDLWNVSSTQEKKQIAKRFGETSPELGDWKPENLQRYVDGTFNDYFGIDVNSDPNAPKPEKEERGFFDRLLGR